MFTLAEAAHHSARVKHMLSKETDYVLDAGALKDDEGQVLCLICIEDADGNKLGRREAPPEQFEAEARKLLSLV